MSVVKYDSNDPSSGITINNYNQQNEPLLFSRRLEELLQKRNRKRLVLYFCIGFVLSAVLAIVAYGLTLGVFELFGFVSEFGSNDQCSKRVIGYQWLSLPYNLTDSQLSKLTHLVFDEARVDENGSIYFSHSAKQENFIEINRRARSFGVKTLISISIRPESLDESESRRELIDSILKFTHDNPLDGVEIDSIELSREHLPNLLELLRELRQKLQILNNIEFIISLSIVRSKTYFVSKGLLKYVDFVNIKTNSYYAPYFSYGSELIGPPTPLYGNHDSSTKGNLNQHMKLHSCISGTPSKLNIMLAFRGHYWKNVIPPRNSSDTLWMTAEIKNETAEGKQISWKDLKNSKVWDISKSSWNHESKTPYIWNPENRTYLAFENERSIKEKMKYAMSENFGGVSIYLLPEDDDEDSLLNIVSSEQWCSSKVSDEVKYDC
ncbi:unnamed protein product [Caenorhabditis brenneri]